MHYLTSVLFFMFFLSQVASAQASETKNASKVPHNNGTNGLLKNTIIEPIENFNTLSKNTSLPTIKKTSSTPVKPDVSALQTEQQRASASIKSSTD